MEGVREAKIEKASCERAKAHGWKVYKFISPGNNGMPDRLFLRKGKAIFIEFKKKKKRPRVLQDTVHKELRDSGFEVYVIDCYDEVLIDGIFK